MAAVVPKPRPATLTPRGDRAVARAPLTIQHLSGLPPAPVRKDTMTPPAQPGTSASATAVRTAARSGAGAVTGASSRG